MQQWLIISIYDKLDHNIIIFALVHNFATLKRTTYLNIQTNKIDIFLWRE